MKIISILQPWATLIAIGAKKIETRSWDTKYRGPLGIHASKKMTREQKELCQAEPFLQALSGIEELPLGAIIGVANLDSTFPTEEFPQTMAKRAKEYGPTTMHALVYGMAENKFGDYTPGRYGWNLMDAKPLTHIIEVGGSLGLWDFRMCRECGCWDNDCRGCIEKTGSPCHWVEEDLCSACFG